MNIKCLTDKTCIPCQGGVSPLAGKEAEKLLSLLGNNWQINQSGHL